MKFKQLFGITGSIALGTAILEAISVLYGPTHAEQHLASLARSEARQSDAAATESSALPGASRPDSLCVEVPCRGTPIFDRSRARLLGAVDLTITVDPAGECRVLRDGIAVTDPLEKQAVIERAGAEILQVRLLQDRVTRGRCASTPHCEEPRTPCPLCTAG